MRWGESTRKHFVFAICDKDSGKHIGNIKLGPIDWKHMHSDLVIVIGDRNYWGRGLASEAISVGNRVAFETYDIKKLFGGMYASNVGSIKAYTRSGWIIEGVRRNHYIVDNKPMDRIIVACFNPQYYDIVGNILERK